MALIVWPVEAFLCGLVWLFCGLVVALVLWPFRPCLWLLLCGLVVWPYCGPFSVALLCGLVVALRMYCVCVVLLCALIVWSIVALVLLWPFGVALMWP